MAKSLGSRYVLHEALGRGAMGQVFAGTIRPTDEPVAIKILRPELVSDPEVVARFVQERTILMSIADPSVVRVIDLVVEGDTLAIVMELVQGADLRRYLAARRTLPAAEALQLTGQLLRGMAAVHAAGIIHRDIKPENVLVDTSNGQPQLKLTDFGVARLSYGASLTRLSGVIGTPEYMAPELAEHNRATPAADIYSAGIVLYEMLCGRTPFAGGHPLAVLRRQTDQAPPVIPGVPAVLWDQIAWMLAKDPGSRPASAAEAYAGLVPLESSLATQPALAPWAGPEAGTPTMSPPPARPTGQQDHAGPVPHATVLRHRDHGEVAAPGDADGPGSRIGAGAGLTAGMQLTPASPSARRKRQVRVAALVVAVVAVLGLVTTVAMAATHRPARPSAAGKQTIAPKANVSSVRALASASPKGTATTTPTPSAVAPGSAPVVPGSTPVTTSGAGSGSGSGSGSGAGGTNPTPAPSVVTETVTGPAVAAPAQTSTQAPPANTSSLSAAEDQLADMLNASVLNDCTGRPDQETGDVIAAINCSYTTAGPSMFPLAETLTSGSGQAWFDHNTSGFTHSNDCVGGEFIGSWTHDGSVGGPLGCNIESNGMLRIVWVIDGNIGMIAEGSDAQTMYDWFRASGCLVPSAC